VLWLHLVLASLLIGLLPFSKLLHGAAVWVNPTRASRAPAAARRGSP
jgi:nitrate reductase gamma subunit